MIIINVNDGDCKGDCKGECFLCLLKAIQSDVRVIKMNQAELLQALTDIKVSADGIGIELVDISTKLNETRVEVLAKLEELSNFTLDPQVKEIVDSLTSTISATKSTIDSIDGQATVLADIIPGSPAP